MAELTALRHIIRAEQNADITVELRLSAFARAAGPRCDALRGQIPPKIIAQAFFGIDVTINRFLTHSQLCPFLDHPIADLLGRPALFDPFNHARAEIRMPDQLALRRTAFLRALMR
jgi:hypothetical protein